MKFERNSTSKDRLIKVLKLFFKKHTYSQERLDLLFRSYNVGKNQSYIVFSVKPEAFMIRCSLHSVKGTNIVFKYGLSKSSLAMPMDTYLKDWYLAPASTSALNLYESMDLLDSVRLR